MNRIYSKKWNLILVCTALCFAIAGCDSGGGGSGGGGGGGGGGSSSSSSGSSKSSTVVTTPTVPTSEASATGAVLLLHFNGDTTDTTGRHADTNNGSVSDNVNYKFGSMSRDFQRASSQYVTFADHADWDFSNADFTIDFWMRTSNTNLMYMFGQYAATCAAASNTVTLTVNNVANKLQAVINSAGVNKAVTGSVTVTDGQWHYIKLQRVSNAMHLYVDGTEDGNAQTGLGVVPGSAASFSVGRPGDCNSAYYDGNIDDFRIVK